MKNLPTFLAKSPYNMHHECADSVWAMRWGMRPSRDTDAMKSRAHHSPNSQYNSLQFRLKNPVHSVKQQNDPRTTVMKRTEKRTSQAQEWWTKSSFPKQRMDSDTLSMKLAHFPDGCVCLWMCGPLPNPTFRSCTRTVTVPMVQARDSALGAHRLKTASYIVNTPYHCFTHATGQSPSRKSAVNSKEKNASNRVVTRNLDDRCERKNSLEEHVLVFPKAPDSHRFREVSSVDVNLVFH